MEIPILVFGPLLWPNHFIVLDCFVLALEDKQTNKQTKKKTISTSIGVLLIMEYIII